MENLKIKQLLACIPVGDDKNKTHNLIHKLATDGSDLFKDFLIIDYSSNKPSEKIIETLEANHFNYTYLNISLDRTNRGYLFKEAMKHAFSNNFEYLTMFNEGWPDNYQDAIKSIENGSTLNHALTVSPRTPNKFNLGMLINKTINLASRIFISNEIFDSKGDSINTFRVSAFYQKNDDLIFNLSDDSSYFQDILTLFGYHRLKIYYTQAQPLQTPGSLIKLNRCYFTNSLCRIISYYFSKSKYTAKYKGVINPRTVRVIKRENIITPSNIQPNGAIEDLRKLKKNQRDVANKLTKIPDTKNTDIYSLPSLEAHEIDPNADIIRLDHIDPKNKDVVVINWCLTNICNYKCSYCPEDLHNGTVKGPKLEEIKSFFYKIQSYHPDKTLFFEFTGGEVTYYKDFLPLIKFIKENGGAVGIISNGARKLDVWEKYHEYIDHICLSFHSEQGDPEHFYNVVAYLTDKMTTHVNIMMKPENFDMCYMLAQRIVYDCEVSIAMQPLMEGMDGDLFDYTESQKKILDEQSLIYGEDPKYKRRADFEEKIYRGAMRATLSDMTTTVYASPELISRNMNKWTGWECYTGVENISIGFNGAIFRGWCMVGGNIGNISDSDLILPSEPIICNKSQCSCGQDIMCTKVRVR